MASEIRVDKINSLSGVGTVTLSPTGVDIAGITTAATLKATTGIVTTLTATTGIVTTLTVNTLQDANGVGINTANVRTGILDVAGIATFRDEVQIITDNKRLKFGAGNDLNIYSTGTNGWVYTPQSGADLYMGTNAGEIYLQTGSSGNDTGLKITSGAAVDLYHNNSVKVRTTSAGMNVYSGNAAGSNAGYVLQVKGGTSDRTTPGIHMEGGTGSDNSSIHALYNLRLGCNSGNSISGREIQFTNGATNLGSFNSNGNFEIDNGNLVIGTAGKGIDFSATSDGSGTDTSELLDDYEEGTWNPVFADAGTGGNTAGSYTHQLGWYTKVGNIVNLQGRLSGCDTTGLTSSHAFYIRNLPYPIESSSNRLITGSALASNINWDSDTRSIGILANVGTSSNYYFRFFQVKDNAAWTSSPVSIVPDGNNEFLWNFTYRTT